MSSVTFTRTLPCIVLIETAMSSVTLTQPTISIDLHAVFYFFQWQPLGWTFQARCSWLSWQCSLHYCCCSWFCPSGIGSMSGQKMIPTMMTMIATKGEIMMLMMRISQLTLSTSHALSIIATVVDIILCDVHEIKRCSLDKYKLQPLFHRFNSSG